MKYQHKYSVFQRLVTIVMMMLMLWLSVCAPVVQASIKKSHTQQVDDTGQADEEGSMPDTSENKCKSALSGICEYLHAHHPFELQSWAYFASFRLRSEGSYHAFHPELVSPPPKA